jgi:glycerol-3-phosphate dehydrogenase
VVDLLKKAHLDCKPNPTFNGYREDPHAFKKMSDHEKDAYIKLHPSYGKIVCRCETVTEGEIRDAIKRNPKANDIDGVKRRTRSGMGRCQGGFCGPYIMKLLAEERRINRRDVSKNGEGSEMIVGTV